MKLQDFINTDIRRSEVAAKLSPATDAAKAAELQRQIRSMTPGQTISAEIVSKNGNEVQIKLADDMYLSARLDQNMNIDIGKLMSFEVRNNGTTLTLSPLFTNTATDANVLKALDMASLPVNNTTVSMTGQLMEAGLPIDRNTLQQVFREINAFPQAEVADIVDLHRLKLPVNEGNVTQMSAYKNLNYQIATGLGQIADEVNRTMMDMVQNGNTADAAKLYHTLMQSMPTEGAMDLDGFHLVSQDNGTQTAQASALLKMLSEMSDVDKEVAGKAEQPMQAASELPARQVLAEELSRLTGQNPERTIGQTTGQTPLMEMTEQELLQLVGKLIDEGLASGKEEVLSKLFENKGMQELLKDNVLKNFALEPKDVAEPGKVEDLYNRLDKQLKDLSKVLEQTGQNHSESFKAVSNMNQNLDFLQQVNQMYTYVQLPLRFQEGKAHGDLYVYTNKKNLADKDGKISALLHLDMEHLGPVDIYVALQNQNVNTQFYVQDDEMLDFLMEHMDLLTNRLKQRGYDCNYKMQVRGEDGDTQDAAEPSGKGGIHNLLVKSGNMPLAQYAFDVRA